MIKQKILQFIESQQFFPEWKGIFVNPFFIARKGLFQAISKHSIDLEGRLLDVGCGSKPYKDLFNIQEYIGLDIDSERSRKAGIADFLYDGKTFPFENCTYDSILSNQVLEHVFNPDEVLDEMYRVLRPGGRLLLTVPFVWDEHEQPYDYARYSSFGLRSLFEKHNFKVLNHQKIGDNISVIFQLVNCYIYKTLPSSHYIRLIIYAAILAPISLLGYILGQVLPDNPDLYLDQIILVEKK